MSKEPTTNSQGLSEECHAMISRISHEVRNPVAVIHSFHRKCQIKQCIEK